MPIAQPVVDPGLYSCDPASRPDVVLQAYCRCIIACFFLDADEKAQRSLNTPSGRGRTSYSARRGEHGQLRAPMPSCDAMRWSAQRACGDREPWPALGAPGGQTSRGAPSSLSGLASSSVSSLQC